MKRLVQVIIVTILLMLSALPLTVSAEGGLSSDDGIKAEFDGIMSDYDIGYSSDDIGGLTFGSLAEKLSERMRGGFSTPLRLLGTLLAVTVLSALLRNTGGSFFKGADSVYSSVSVLTAVSVIAPELFKVLESAVQAVLTGGDFVAVFIPVFAGITAVSGNIASAGIYDAAVLAASELIVQLSSGLLMPVVSSTVMLSVTGSVFSGNDMGGIVRLLRKLITWGMTVTMSLFTGIVTLKCTLAGKTDGAATKTARFVISGLVPVVGSAVSDAYASVKGGFEVVRGTVGTGGCIAILLIALPPVLHILIFRGVLWTGAAVAEMFGETQMNKLLKSLESGLSIAQSVLVCYGVMFVLCTGILMQTAG